MEVLAVSRSVPKEHNIQGIKLTTSIIHDPLTSHDEFIEVDGSGVVGNKTAAHDGPVYAFFAENYDYWCSELGIERSSWDWCHWGENITLRYKGQALLENDIHLGDIWKIGASVRLEHFWRAHPLLLRMNKFFVARKLTTIEDKLNDGKHAWKGWRKLLVFHVVDEGYGLKSFYLRAMDDQPLANYVPGQFLSLRVPNGKVRSWTISDFPTRDGPEYYRISVKRGSEASAWMHDQCTEDTVLPVRSPAGRFVLDWTGMPMRQVYISAGIGITPVLAMMKAHAFHPKFIGVPALWIHVAQGSRAFPFQEEILALSGIDLQRHVFFTRPTKEDALGVHYDYRGRPDAKALREILGASYKWNPLGGGDMDVDAKLSAFYICGPPEFETSIKTCLKELGTPPPFIHSESFSTSGGAIGDLKKAQVRFTKSNKSATWTKDSPVSLLELAESLGLTPDYGCRVGACGSCAAKVTCGSVTGGVQMDGKVLTCSATPASDSVEVEL
ncbi:hypothetical protein BJ170DRAFT_588153 [Xylariales sp. AK1849]|nr:hypothetical protein BJ170DRAFT_588153 [Xylariales sp. AK1849]